MELDREIQKLQHLTQKIAKLIKNGKNLTSSKSTALIDECKSIREKLENAVSRFVDSNDYSNFDRVISVLHASGEVLSQLNKELGIPEESNNTYEEEEEEDAFSRIQFSNAVNKDSDDKYEKTRGFPEEQEHVFGSGGYPEERDHYYQNSGYVMKNQSPRNMEREDVGAPPTSHSSFSSFQDVIEESPHSGFGDDVTFQADFSSLNLEQPRRTSIHFSKQESNSEAEGPEDVNSLKKSLSEALQVINDYKTYCNTLEDLIRDLAVGRFQLSAHDKSTFLEVNKDSTTFISNLSSALGISIMKPPVVSPSVQHHYDNRVFQPSYNEFTPSPRAPVSYLRRVKTNAKIPFVDPVSLSNYLGRFMCNPSEDLIRFGNIFNLSLNGEFVKKDYVFTATIKCLTQSVDIYMAFQDSAYVKSASVLQHLTKNSSADIKGALDITVDEFPSLSLSIVQSDGFAVKFLIQLPLGPFLLLSSNYLTNQEFNSVWESSVYNNSKLSFSELSLFKYESGCTLPNPLVIFEDIKNTLTLNGRINVTSMSVQSQTASFHITSTLDKQYLQVFNIDAHKFKECLQTCLIGKVYVKLISNIVNIKLELNSIVQSILISTRRCLKEALSAVLSERSPSTVSAQTHSMGKDITLPLPFEEVVNEDIDFN